MNNQLKQFESRKMFYSEYLYKLVFRNELSTIFRSDYLQKERLNYARVSLDKLTEQKRNNIPMHRKQWNADILINENDYFDAIDIYSSLKNISEYKLRIDPGSMISIFSNDKLLLTTLASKLRTKSIELWAPNQDYIDILKSKTKIVIVDSRPDLELRVWFNSKKLNLDFAKWIRANSDKCKIGSVALHGLESNGYLGGLYIYLRDEKVLNLVTIIAGSSIRSVEKLVCKDDIDKYMYGS
jgi:hypothetical protein